MTTILTAILPLFILILVGVALQKSLPPEPPYRALLCKVGLGSCETTTSVLNRFALYLALPALIISSLINARGETILSPGIILVGALAVILLILSLFLVTHLLHIEPALANTYIFCGFFGNVAYIGLPFLSILIPGSEAALSILIALHVAIAFSVGIAILEWTKRKHVHLGALLLTVIKNPLVLSVVAGLLLFFIPIPIPTALTRTLSMLGASASPVVLVAIGTFMATKWHPAGTVGHALAISALKLGVLPLLTLILGVWMLPSTGMTLTILEAAMPVALTNFALSEIYPMRQKIIANAIILSTLLSLGTLLLWSSILL